MNIPVDFDKLGLTDNENPLGVFPFLGRSMGRAAGTFLGMDEQKFSPLLQLDTTLFKIYQAITSATT